MKLKISSVSEFWRKHGGTISVSITFICFLIIIGIGLVNQFQAEETRQVLERRIKQAESDLSLLRNDNVLMLRYYNCINLYTTSPVTNEDVAFCAEKALSPTGLTNTEDNLLYRSSWQGIRDEATQ